MAKQSGSKDQPNKQQRLAIEHGNGPMLVVAGAGTGKTKVIVERILRLIADGVDGRTILALTFTEKAAQEMLDRVVQDLSGSYGLDLPITTFNAFGEMILKEFAPEIGLGSNLRLLGDVGKIVFLKEHLDELDLDYFAPISKPDGQLGNLGDYFSRLKQQLVWPQQYSRFANALPKTTPADKLEQIKHQELAKAYKTYIELCRQLNFIDYDDQLFMLVELLKRRPNVLAKLRQRYKYVLVDEFQDTNPMQSAVIDLLVEVGQNLMAVGDDDQSIYGWRGATLANILDFKQRYKKGAEVTLIENFRSTQSILDAAYKLIQHNNPNRLESMHHLDKRLVARRGSGQQPRLKAFASLASELDWIATDIKERLADSDKPASIAVLTRRNHTAQLVHEALELVGVDHVLAGASTDLYSHPAVGAMIEALKTVVDPHDGPALYHTLGGPLFGLNPQSLAEHSALARRQHVPLAQLLRQSQQPELLQALSQIDDWRSRSHKLGVGRLSYDIITDSGFKTTVYSDADSPDGLIQAQSLSSWFQTLKQFERVTNTPSALSYLDSLDALKNAGDEITDDTPLISPGSVNVMSVHKAKGLEWRTVYIADCTEFSFPMRSVRSSLSVPESLAVQTPADDYEAEERRLMYVAMTRAQDEVILTYARTHTGRTPRRPSRFLLEMFGQEEVVDSSDAAEQTSLELFSDTNPALATVRLPSSILAGDKLLLSTSMVDDYLRCPQDFYYRHVLGVPPEPDPAPIVGTLIHDFIQQINQARIAKRPPPALKQLTAQLIAGWPLEGYGSSVQLKRAQTATLAHLKPLYKRLIQDEIPLMSEQKVKVSVPGAGLILTGRIDAVLPAEDGVEIRDYKSGTGVQTAEKAKSRATASKQLALYALAWRLKTGEAPVKLSLDFVQTGLIGEVKKQAKTLDTLQAKLKTIVSAIRAGEFPPGYDHASCRHK